jgi:hypothetical protein
MSRKESGEGKQMSIISLKEIVFRGEASYGFFYIGERCGKRECFRGVKGGVWYLSGWPCGGI